MRYIYLLVTCLIVTVTTNAQHYRLKTLSHDSYHGDSLKFVPTDTFYYSYFPGKGGVIPYATFAANQHNRSYQAASRNYKLYFVPEMKYDSCLIAYTLYNGKQVYSVAKQYLDGNDNIISRKDGTNKTNDSFVYTSNKMMISSIGYNLIGGF